jgi:choline kinase
VTGIVIAAGRGLRMRPHTNERPKCMLPVNGVPLLWRTLAALRDAGCGPIVVITGHCAEAIDAPNCTVVHNAGYARNNILHSLMHARESFDDDLLITYSDIVVEPSIHRALVSARGDIVLAVDRDWRGYYRERPHHPITEAEKAHVRETAGGAVLMAIGKHLDAADPDGGICGEFLGLWKMTRAGAQRFRQRFDAIDARLGPCEPFRKAAEWQKAYVTDFFADLIASNEEVRCLLIERGWAELDVVEDYERLPALIQAQRLFSLGASS